MGGYTALMENKPHNSNITVLLPRNVGALYNAFIHKIPCTPGRNLSIEVDFDKMRPLLDNKRPTLELLCTEIKLWSEIIGKRLVTSLSLTQPTKLLASFELTRFMHCIASHFSLNPPPKALVVVTDADEVTKEFLALLKGLNFNGVRIVVSEAQLHDALFLQTLLMATRTFGFTHVGIHIHYTNCLNDICQEIKFIEHSCNPDYISLGNETEPSLVVGCHECNIMPHKDLLNIGLEGVSQIHDITIQNFCSPSKYQAALSANRLPIHTGEYVS